MKFKNKKTNEVVEANTYIKVFAFTHNSNYVIYDGSSETLNKETASHKTTKKDNNTKSLDDGIVIE